MIDKWDGLGNIMNWRVFTLLRFQFLQRLMLVVASLALIACGHPLIYRWSETVLQGNPEDLKVELNARQSVRPIVGEATFHVENMKETLVDGRTPENAGAQFRLLYPAGMMLKQTGEATVQRWFVLQDHPKTRVDISSRIEDLYYNDASVDRDKARPVIAVKLHIRATLGGKILVDGIYESGKQYGAYFKSGVIARDTEQYETQYSRTIYKAILIALDKAMTDLAFQLAQQLRGSE